MASAQIQTLLRAADTAQAQNLVLEYLNTHFKTLADLDDQFHLEKLVQEAEKNRNELEERVRAISHSTRFASLMPMSQLSFPAHNRT